MSKKAHPRSEPEPKNPVFDPKMPSYTPEQAAATLHPTPSVPLIQHIKCTFDDFKGQDAQIEMMDTLGYAHYESIRLGGNEMLLRFRRK